MATVEPDNSKTLARYSNLECPDKVTLCVTFSLLVHLLLKPPKPDMTSIDIEDQDLSDKLPEVDLVISAIGFDIKETNTKFLKVNRSNNSDERFVLTPRVLGEQEIRVDFYQNGRRIGIERCIVIVTQGSPVSEGIKRPELSRPLRLKFELSRVPPDLEICILQDKRDKLNLSFVLYTSQKFNVNAFTSEKLGYNHIKSGEVSLNALPKEKIKDLFYEMSLMARSTVIGAERRMAALGNELWDELISPELKNRYWEFEGHVKSILITSDEPWIPWEMIKPYRYSDNGEREDDLFWCQKFDLSRWLSGPATEEKLSTGRAQPVAPASGDLPVILEKEVKFIEQLSNLHPGIIGSPYFKDIREVLDFIDNENFTLLHFATHSKFDSTLPNNSSIQLFGGCLRPSDIHTRFGKKRSRPLIFINACEAAQMGFSFTQLGGWADRLVNRAEVGAFVGAMWEVEDSLALKFAKSFYTALLKHNQTIAHAFRKAREDVRKVDPSNSTWLAYVLYADPEALYIGNGATSAR